MPLLRAGVMGGVFQRGKRGKHTRRRPVGRIGPDDVRLAGRIEPVIGFCGAGRLDVAFEAEKQREMAKARGEGANLAHPFIFAMPLRQEPVHRFPGADIGDDDVSVNLFTVSGPHANDAPLLHQQCFNPDARARLTACLGNDGQHVFGDDGGAADRIPRPAFKIGMRDERVNCKTRKARAPAMIAPLGDKRICELRIVRDVGGDFRNGPSTPLFNGLAFPPFDDLTKGLRYRPGLKHRKRRLPGLVHSIKPGVDCFGFARETLL